MTEADWGEEGAKPRKRGVPAWVWWGCGGGCLLMTLVAGALAVAGIFVARNATDEEKQWPRLGEVMAFDQRPANIRLQFGISFGVNQFVMTDEANRIHATLTEYPDRESASSQMDPDPGGPLALIAPVDPEKGELEVQGRAVPVLRFRRLKAEPETEELGHGIRLDLTGDTGKPRILEMRRLGEDPLDAEDVAAFLAPFDVWRGH